MAKKAEMRETPEPRKGNSFVDPEKIQALFGRVDNLEGDLLSERSEYMLKCKDIRGDIREVIKEAEALGINKTAFKALLKERTLLNKAAEAVNLGDIDLLHQVEAMRDALGEYGNTPLGQAAINQAANGTGLPAEL